MQAQGATRQELDKEVVWRTYRISSLTTLTLNGVRHEIIHAGTVEVNGVIVQMNPPAQAAAVA
jgi:hypothetical protein